MPQPEHLATQSSTNRQGRGAVLEGQEAAKVLQILREDASRSHDHYVEMMNEDESGIILRDGQHGLARELARMNLTLNFYTQWYWKVNLHNFMHFLSLRADQHAQYEIRIYAETMLKILEKWVPQVYEAFCDYRLSSFEMSSPALAVVKKLVAGDPVDQAGSGLSSREWHELMVTLDLKET